MKKKVRKIREIRNYSQEYMAIQLGISQKSYSRLENGQTRLYIYRLQEIAKILNIDIIQMFSFDENNIFKKDPT